MELIAHVWNFGDTASGLFEYEWTMDGKALSKGRHEGLGPGGYATVVLGMDWPDADSNPAVTFTVDPEDHISELMEFNNQVVDWIKGYTLGFSFMPLAYDNLRRLHWGEQAIYSPEHYIHRHITRLNEMLAEAGLDDRVRSELLIVIEDRFIGESHPTRPYIDGWWPLWDDKPLFTDSDQRHPDISYGLLHELLHQLGVIDLYRMHGGLEFTEVPNANRPGKLAGCGREYWGDDRICFRFPKGIHDIMSGGPNFIGVHTAGGLASNSGYRRGFYGEYLYDTPGATVLKMVDQGGIPLPGVDLHFYQFEYESRRQFTDAIPEFQVSTDAQGLAVLPNRGITGIVTATGHQLRPNPFGVVDNVGRDGLFVIEMDGECINYEWLTIVDLNLAYWEGFVDEAIITKTLRCPPP